MGIFWRIKRHSLSDDRRPAWPADDDAAGSTKAAKELNVSQPSLSNSINRLEKRLGVQLFERQGRHVKLNAFGKTYLRRVERSFLELEEGEREITDI